MNQSLADFLQMWQVTTSQFIFSILSCHLLSSWMTFVRCCKTNFGWLLLGRIALIIHTFVKKIEEWKEKAWWFVVLLIIFYKSQGHKAPIYSTCTQLPYQSKCNNTNLTSQIRRGRFCRVCSRFSLMKICLFFPRLFYSNFSRSITY